MRRNFSELEGYMSEGTDSLSGRKTKKEERGMARFHKTIEIKAPVSSVFSFIEDPNHGPEVMTNMIEVKDVQGTAKGSHYKWTWSMAGMKFKGENTIIEDVPNKKIVINSKGGIESTWTYNFEPRGDATILDLDIEYKIPVPILGKMAENLLLKRNEREAETNLMNLKDRLEARS
jgi:uncharacterized membrane protein